MVRATKPGGCGKIGWSIRPRPRQGLNGGSARWIPGETRPQRAAMADGANQVHGWTAAEHGLPDTFPKLLARNATKFGARPAMREKDYGIWQSWTWAQVQDEVRSIAAGLAAIGVKRGVKVALVGDNRPQLYWAVCAAQMLGAVPVPVYQDAVAAEMGFVIDHAEADIAIAED